MGCDIEKRTLSELYDAITHKEGALHNINVPVFQRGKCWKEEEEKDFIESVRTGLPFGSMLIYRKQRDGKFIETLIDGLQRSTAIKKYIEHPLKFTNKGTLSDEIAKQVLNEMNIQTTEDNIDEFIEIVKDVIWNFFEECDEKGTDINDIEVFKVAKGLINELNPVKGLEIVEEIMDIIKPFIKSVQDEYKTIKGMFVPLVVYEGDEENLPIIFNKINSKGVALNELEIYSATWPEVRTLKVENEGIINAVIKKYDQLKTGGFSLEGLNVESVRLEKMLTPFEYIFGLSKYLTTTYPMLKFMESKEKPDTINGLAFDLVNVCLNKSKKERDTLYENILAIDDINEFEKALIEAIEYVQGKIRLVTAFKGNTRTNSDTKFHGKYQIMSLVANVFRAMYLPELTEDDGKGNIKKITWKNKKAESWKQSKKILDKTVLLYYVHDILYTTWYDGSPSKIYTFASPNRYLSEIQPDQWNICLDFFFQNSSMDANKINPDMKDQLMLNCIYLDKFTFKDNAKEEIKFDIEHLAPKERLKEIKEKTGCDSIVVGSIGNLCFLKEGTNRGKGEKTIYEYEPIADKIADIEEKYSFTNPETLEWVAGDYNKNDVEKVQKIYRDYLYQRFKIQKKQFFLALDIAMPDENSDIEEQTVVDPKQRIIPPLPPTEMKVGAFIRLAMENLSNSGFVFTDEELKNITTIEWGQKNLKTGGIIAFAKLHVDGATNEHLNSKGENIYIKKMYRFGEQYIFIKVDLFAVSKEPFIKWYKSLGKIRK